MHFVRIALHTPGTLCWLPQSAKGAAAFKRWYTSAELFVCVD